MQCVSHRSAAAGYACCLHREKGRTLVTRQLGSMVGKGNKTRQCKELTEVARRCRTTRTAASQTEPTPGNPSTQASPSAQQPPAAPGKPTYGTSYYAGLLTNDLREDNKATGSDMLKRSLQLAGGVALLLVALVAGFLASNGLL